MQEIKYVIKDKMGIHARPAGLFVKEAASYPCQITIATDNNKVDAKRILGVMSLGVKYGQEITVQCDGEKETEAAEAMRSFLEANL